MRRKGENMTEQEKQEIIAEVEKNVMEEVSRRGKEESAKVLKVPREKWYGDRVSRFDPLRDPLMQDAFDSPYMAWDAWEHIRRLTCLVCGSRYVRQLEGDPNAEKVCEEICQKIYDLRMEITKNESSTD